MSAVLRVPVLGFNRVASPGNEADRIIIGTADLTLDGAPFPWTTVDDWTVTFTEDGVTKLNINIVVTLPKDPAA